MVCVNITSPVIVPPDNCKYFDVNNVPPSTKFKDDVFALTIKLLVEILLLTIKLLLVVKLLQLILLILILLLIANIGWYVAVALACVKKIFDVSFDVIKPTGIFDKFE